MGAMRQRLLLAAGWIIAVVGSGVVASGAVAVAGGQVLDRPLRPLTAAEVAALPVVGSVVNPVPNEPLASGGSASTSGDTTTGSVGGNATDRSTEDSAGPGGAPFFVALPRPDDVVITTLTSIAPTSGATTSQSAIVILDGGAASILSSADGLAVLWARPNPGYVMSLRFDAADALVLSFTGPTDRFRIAVNTVDGVMTVDTAEPGSL